MSNNNSLKVLLAGAECAPFVKLGGLAKFYSEKLPSGITKAPGAGS
mgnify:CR=1 FL=1